MPYTYEGACFIYVFLFALVAFLFCKHLVNFDVLDKYLGTKKFIPLVSSPRQPKFRGLGGDLNCTLILLLLVLGHIFAHI